MRDRDPFDDFRRMQEEFSRMFSSMFSSAFSNMAGLTDGDIDRMRTPAADTWETDNHIVVHMEVPGAEKDNIEINAVQGGLEVKVEQKQEAEAEEENMRSYRKTYSGYYRQVPMPPYAETGKAQASYENGILEIKVPKKKGAKKEKKRIDVK